MRSGRAFMLTSVTLLAACGGGTKPAASSGASSTTTLLGAGAEAGTSTKGAGAPAAAASRDTTSTARDSSLPSSGAASNSATVTTGAMGAGAPAASPTLKSGEPAPAVPGTYKYKQTGSASFGNSTQSVPPEGSLVVDPASPTNTQVWHRYQDTTKKPSDQDISFTGAGPFITSITMQSPAAPITCTFTPPGIPAPPWPPAVGKSFSVQGDCGSFHLTVAGKLTGKKTVAVGGNQLTVWVLDTTITSTGAVKIDGTEEDWISPALRLSVHTYSNTTGSYGAYSFKATTTSDLESANPS